MHKYTAYTNFLLSHFSSISKTTISIATIGFLLSSTAFAQLPNGWQLTSEDEGFYEFSNGDLSAGVSVIDAKLSSVDNLLKSATEDMDCKQVSAKNDKVVTLECDDGTKLISGNDKENGVVYLMAQTKGANLDNYVDDFVAYVIEAQSQEANSSNVEDSSEEQETETYPEAIFRASDAQKVKGHGVERFPNWEFTHSSVGLYSINRDNRSKWIAISGFDADGMDLQTAVKQVIKMSPCTGAKAKKETDANGERIYVTCEDGIKLVVYGYESGKAYLFNVQSNINEDEDYKVFGFSDNLNIELFMNAN